MESTEKHSRGLPGLRYIRQALGITTIQSLARIVNIYWGHIGKIERGMIGCSLESLRTMTKALCCSADDLINIPSEERLLEVKANYLRRAADQAAMAVTEWSPRQMQEACINKGESK